MKRANLINSKTVFVSTIIVVPISILIVYFSGINEHRSLYLNSLLSTSILSIVFLTFITTGLYNGWKLKDSLGNILHKFNLLKKPENTTLDVTGMDFNIIEADGIEGCLISIVIWIIMALFGSFIFWAIGAFIWGPIVLLAAILYWIIFRAFRLIFTNSAKCQGQLLKSFSVALLFTFLYNCWIYAVIFGIHYFK